MRALLLLLVLAVPASAQEFTYRGFGQIQSTAYPADHAAETTREFAVDALFRIEPAYRPADWLTLSGSIDARIDTVEQVERAWRVDVRDRGVQRPALSLRHARATLRKGTLTADLGKQFVRWGKADILNPTDRFAPRDFLEVTDDEFLAVIGARGQYERGPHSIDVVWVPTFTPSRTPLVGRRWAPPPPQTFGPTGFVDLSPCFPIGRSTAPAGMCSARASSSRFRISTASTTCRSSRRFRCPAGRSSRFSALTRRSAWPARTPPFHSAGSR